MADRLLHVHIQSPAGLWAWVTLRYNSSDIRLCWNYDLLTFVEPCDFTSRTLVGSTPPKVNGVGVISLCIGSYVDHLGERHPLDMAIPKFTVSVRVHSIHCLPLTSRGTTCF